MIIELPIPKGKKILIKEKDDVNFDTPLVKVINVKSIKIPISQELDIPPKKIFLTLTKNVGDQINLGDIIAKKKSLLSEKKYLSDFAGVLKEIDHDEGSILIEAEDKEGEKINSFFKGKVHKIKDGIIEIEVQAAEKFQLIEASDNFGGEVTIADEQDLNKIKQNISNKVLLIKKIQTYNQLKLEVMGAVGYITIEPLSKQIDIPYARIKNIEDWEKIKKLNLPYCSIIKSQNIVYFYR